MRQSNIIIAILLITLASCDCVVHEEGIVLDGTTGKPIEGVSVTYDKRTFKTDMNGQYKIDYITGFCPDRNFVFEKEKYRPMELRIERDSDNLSYSVKTKNDFIDYTNPKYLDSTKRSFTTGKWVELTSTNFSFKNDTLTIYLDK